MTQTAAAAPSDAAMTNGVILLLEQLTMANATTPSVRSPFHSTHTPPMTIRLYCDRIVKYSKCTPEAFVVGMMLLCKFTFFTQHPITIFNVHRMLITSTLIAAKMRDDEYYANTYYARIGGITAEELNALELHFLTILTWDMWIGEDEFECAVAMLLTIKDAAAAGSTDLVRQVWSNWLEAFEGHTRSRHQRVCEMLKQDQMSVTPVTRAPATPGSVSEAARRRGAQSAISSATYRARASRTTPTTASAFPTFPSQQSIGHCESSASVDQEPSKDGGNQVDSSRDNSGSLGPDASMDQSPNELTGMTAIHNNSGTFPSTSTVACSSVGKSWANIARTRPNQLKTDDCTECSPRTPSSRSESNFSSQQVTPTRMLTKQRFNNSSAKNTPTSIRRHADPATSSVSAMRQVTPPVQLVDTPTVASAGGSQREGKKRPKPEHYQDYR